MALKIFMVAGEASADAHGAALLKELKTRRPDIHCFGVGEQCLAREGMEIVVNARSINVVGTTDWMESFREVIGAYRDVGRVIAKRRPDCAILLDLPDFNLRLAKKLKRLGIPVIYYISPQVWAWRKYRISTIRRFVDRMLVVFPFEKGFYEKHGVGAEFVGHPLLDSIHPRSAYRGSDEIRAAPRLAVLPGSRKSELRFHAPLLRDTLRLLWEMFPKLEVRIPVAPTLLSSLVREAFPDPRVELVASNSLGVLEWADVALVASGTATLETALVGTPFALFYVLSPFSSWVARNFPIYRGFLGMPNLLHAKKVVQEFFQPSAKPEALSEEMTRLIRDSAYRETVTKDIRECRSKLGLTGASARAASQVLDFMEARERGSVELAVPQPT